MDKIIDFLDGKKTIIGVVILFIAGGLKAINAIDDNAFKVIESIGIAISAFGIRMAVKKLE